MPPVEAKKQPIVVVGGGFGGLSAALELAANASDIPVVPRIDKPVDPKIVEELLNKFTDFKRAYDENGLSVEEFDTFGSTMRTLRQFLEAGPQLNAQIRDFMIPNPDAKLA